MGISWYNICWRCWSRNNFTTGTLESVENDRIIWGDFNVVVCMNGVVGMENVWQAGMCQVWERKNGMLYYLGKL